MKIQDEKRIPFWDVVVMKKYGCLMWQVYKKNIHSNRYLHANLHHFLTHKLVVINTLVTRAIRISYKDHIEQELNHLSKVYSRGMGMKISNLKRLLQKQKKIGGLVQDNLNKKGVLKSSYPTSKG
jgi:hypothetical protein